jgi:hypothetical protein
MCLYFFLSALFPHCPIIARRVANYVMMILIYFTSPAGPSPDVSGWKRQDHLRLLCRRRDSAKATLVTERRAETEAKEPMSARQPKVTVDAEARATDVSASNTAGAASTPPIAVAPTAPGPVFVVSPTVLNVDLQLPPLGTRDQTSISLSAIVSHDEPRRSKRFHS